MQCLQAYCTLHVSGMGARAHLHLACMPFVHHFRFIRSSHSRKPAVGGCTISYKRPRSWTRAVFTLMQYLENDCQASVRTPLVGSEAVQGWSTTFLEFQSLQGCAILGRPGPDHTPESTPERPTPSFCSWHWHLDWESEITIVKDGQEQLSDERDSRAQVCMSQTG